MNKADMMLSSYICNTIPTARIKLKFGSQITVSIPLNDSSPKLFTFTDVKMADIDTKHRNLLDKLEKINGLM